MKLRELEKQREMSDQCEGREAGDGGRVTMEQEEEEEFGLSGHNYDNIQSFKVLYCIPNINLRTYHITGAFLPC